MSWLKGVGVACVMGLVVGAMGCGSEEDDRRAGICYCDFASGDKQEYDLRGMELDEQKVECQRHDKNAAAFGGECELQE